MIEQFTETGLQIVRVRLADAGIIPGAYKVSSPDEAARLIAKELSMSDREVVGVMNLTNAGDVINFHIVSMGTLSTSLIHPREAFKASILSNAASIIMFHNHPSGNTKPSQEDIDVTERMVKAGNLLGISVLDHVIVAGHTAEYYSMREAGYVTGHRESHKEMAADRSLPMPEKGGRSL